MLCVKVFSFYFAIISWTWSAICQSEMAAVNVTPADCDVMDRNAPVQSCLDNIRRCISGVDIRRTSEETIAGTSEMLTVASREFILGLFTPA